MKVLILTDSLMYDEDVVRQYDQMSVVLRKIKEIKEVEHLEVSLNLESFVASIEKIRPDYVFNLVESVSGKMELIAMVPKILESMGIRFSGSGSFSLETSTDKVKARKMMALNHLPIAKDGVENIRYIVKAKFEHGSFNLDESNVVNNLTAAKQKMKELEEKYNTEFMREAYIEGREFTVAFTDDAICEPIEFVFSNSSKKEDVQILSKSIKWSDAEDVYGYESSEIEPELVFKLKFFTKMVKDLFDMKDYGRIDFRCDAEKNLYIIDVNSNPSLEQDTSMVRSLEKEGLSLELFMRRIILGEKKVVEVNKQKKSGTEKRDILFRYGFDFKRKDELLRAFKTVKNFNVHDYGVFEGVLSECETGEEEYFVNVVEVNGVMEGCCISVNIPLSNNVYEIYWVFVSDRYKGLGLGQQLFDGVENYLRGLGAKSLFLDTELEEKYDKTIKFYFRNNFEIDTIEQNFYGPKRDKIVFKKYF